MKKRENTLDLVVKKLEEMINGIRKEKSNQYLDGLIDGLIIAIRTIDG